MSALPDDAEFGLPAEDALALLAERIRVCRNCDLAWNRSTAVPGEGNAHARIMLVGEAPGAAEDRTGRPFVGPSGKFLDSMLAEIGLDRAAAFIANVNRCRPPENRDPTSQEVAACHPWLAAQIRVIGPKVICPLGRFALEALVDPRLKISQVHGQPVERDGILYIPLYHPAAALHRQDLRDTLRADMRRVREILVERGL
jgi:DNA polymerase